MTDAGLPATFVRPWYVLGPGHRWPLALIPLYWVAERVPATRAQARRLGLVSLSQMIRTLVDCVENPPPVGPPRVIDVPQIRNTRLRDRVIRPSASNQTDRC